MKELFRISTLLEGPSLPKLRKVKLPKAVVDEIVPLIKKLSKVVDTLMDETISELKEDKDGKEK